MGIYVVVAQEFEQFSKHANVMSYETLLRTLEAKGPAGIDGPKYVAGQGLGFKDIEYAYGLAVSKGFSHEFEHWHTWFDAEPAGQELSHKAKTENVLISVPTCTGDDTYSANLLLHARNELMLDHLTGQHVQGMVLLEACRQMFLAVTERFHLVGYQPTKRYFVLNEMNVRYSAFAFPLPAEIRYRIIERQQPRPDRVDIQADMEVWQSGHAVTKTDVKFTVMDGNRLGEREAKLASSAVSAHVSSLRHMLNTRRRNDARVMTEPMTSM